MTDELPPLPTTEPNIEDGLCYYETDEVLDYGRACWNAAIDAALDAYYDYEEQDDAQCNVDVAIRALKRDAAIAASKESILAPVQQ